MNSLPATLELMHLFGDETRVRLLALLEQEELTVAELTSITLLPQSRVSTHLGKLRDAGLLRDRKSGVSSFYALKQLDTEVDKLWRLLRNGLDDPVLTRDKKRLAELVLSRRENAKWTDTVAGEMERHYSPGRTWEATARGLVGFVRLGDTLDIGCGDGAIGELIVDRAHTLTCLDKSDRMISAARRRLARKNNVRFCVGDMHELPFSEASFDDVMMFNALTYSTEPEKALSEAARVLRPGGRVVVLALERHEHRQVVSNYDHENLGFRDSELSSMLEGAGLEVESCAVCSQERRKPYFSVLSAFGTKPGPLESS